MATSTLPIYPFGVVWSQGNLNFIKYFVELIEIITKIQINIMSIVKLTLDDTVYTRDAHQNVHICKNNKYLKSNMILKYLHSIHRAPISSKCPKSIRSCCLHRLQIGMKPNVRLEEAFYQSERCRTNQFSELKDFLCNSGSFGAYLRCKSSIIWCILLRYDVAWKLQQRSNSTLLLRLQLGKMRTNKFPNQPTDTSQWKWHSTTKRAMKC